MEGFDKCTPKAQSLEKLPPARFCLKPTKGLDIEIDSLLSLFRPIDSGFYGGGAESTFGLTTPIIHFIF